MLKCILLRSSSKSLCLTETSRGHLDFNLYFWKVGFFIGMKMSLDVAAKYKGKMISQHSEYHSFGGGHVERGPGNKHEQEDNYGIVKKEDKHLKSNQF